MGDAVFVVRVLAASVVALVLLLGTGMNGSSGSLPYPARHSLAGK